MKKRYNLKLVEMDSGKTVHEIELRYTVSDSKTMGGVYIDNPIHTMFVEIEQAIAEENAK